MAKVSELRTDSPQRLISAGAPHRSLIENDQRLLQRWGSLSVACESNELRKTHRDAQARRHTRAKPDRAVGLPYNHSKYVLGEKWNDAAVHR